MQGKVYIWNGLFLFLGTIADTAVHRHHAVQLVFSLDGSFSIDTETDSFSANAVLIGSDTPHRLKGQSGTQVLVLVESGSDTASRLKAVLNGKGIITISEELLSKDASSEFLSIISSSTCNTDILAALNSIINAIAHGADNPNSIDPRIEKARDLINSLPEKKIFAHDIAETLLLSETRFIHLFKQETGIPFRRYVLWKRMMDSILVLLDTADITRAAHEAGFADSSHLARTFKENFGIILSDIFKNDRFVQVIVCSSW